VADLLSSQIEKIGPTKVVNVNTDHAPEMMAAWEILKARYPWISFTGCQNHTTHLLSKDIVNVPEVKAVIEDCKDVAQFFR
jgi:hypothetical protein